MPSPANEEPATARPIIGYASPATSSGYAVILCRILSIWMFAWGLYQGTSVLGIIGGYIFGLFGRDPGRFSETVAFGVAGAVPAVIWLLMAWYCWRKAPSIAQRMTREVMPSPLRGMTADELLCVVLIGVGVFMLGEGLPIAARLVYDIIDRVRQGTNTVVDFDASIVSSLIRCGLGLWLILGSGGTAQLVRKHSGRWHDESKGSSDESNPKSE